MINVFKEKTKGPLIALIILSVVCLSMFYVCLKNVTISFDAAMNDQVCKNLSIGKGYATDYIDEGYNGSSSLLFDHKIQTGATVIFPTALLDKIFGYNSKHMQIVLLLYWFALILEVYFEITKRFCWIAGLVTSIFIIPFTIENVFNGYGEVAMFFFMFSTILMFSKAHSSCRIRYWIITGVIAALGYLTKTVFLIMLPALIISFVVDIKELSWKTTWKKYGIFAAEKIFCLWSWCSPSFRRRWNHYIMYRNKVNRYEKL